MKFLKQVQQSLGILESSEDDAKINETYEVIEEIIDEDLPSLTDSSSPNIQSNLQNNGLRRRRSNIEHEMSKIPERKKVSILFHVKNFIIISQKIKL